MKYILDKSSVIGEHHVDAGHEVEGDGIIHQKYVGSVPWMKVKVIIGQSKEVIGLVDSRDLIPKENR
jgi:hypothetical protein